MPQLLAVPEITLIACSKSLVFKSAIFSLAISITCCLVTSPMISFPTCPLAFAKLAALFKSTEAGGVLIIKSKDLSS
jgi:hypothetical protein